MNTEEIMKLADAYAAETANAREGWPACYRKESRAALEAALSAKQGEQCSQVTSEYSEQEPTHWPEAPKEIYLVVCGDDDCDQPFREHGEVTWCEDMIHATDIRYVRADTHPAPSVNAQERPALLPPDNDPMVLRRAERISELEAQNAQLLEALKGLEPYLDRLVCYASTATEHKPNEAVMKANAAIAAVEGKV